MKSIVKRTVQRYSGKDYVTFWDNIIVEEELEIFINQSNNPFLLTMRTPGDDEVLALGLLFNHGVIHGLSDVLHVKNINDNQLLIQLTHNSIPKSRTFSAFSSCGICNANTWEEVNFHSNYPIFDKSFKVSPEFLIQSFHTLNDNEDHFSLTGGNHQVALVSENSSTIFKAEDVGRHNAFDKVIGQCIKSSMLPLKQYIAVLSGRCSFEMCQKSWMAGIPIIISRGAPTSKAIQLAEDVGITLLGFAKADRFNIYTHPYRINNERR